MIILCQVTNWFCATSSTHTHTHTYPGRDGRDTVCSPLYILLRSNPGNTLPLRESLKRSLGTSTNFNTACQPGSEFLFEILRGNFWDFKRVRWVKGEYTHYSHDRGELIVLSMVGQSRGGGCCACIHFSSVGAETVLKTREKAGTCTTQSKLPIIQLF